MGTRAGYPPTSPRLCLGSVVGLASARLGSPRLASIGHYTKLLKSLIIDHNKYSIDRTEAESRGEVNTGTGRSEAESRGEASTQLGRTEAESRGEAKPRLASAMTGLGLAWPGLGMASTWPRLHLDQV